MTSFIENIFKEYPSLVPIFNGDDTALLLKVTGNSLISVSFLFIGFLCLIRAGKPPQAIANKERTKIAKLIGWFILSCGISRGFTVYCIWHNYIILSSIIDIITGTIAFRTLFYIPKVTKALKNSVDLSEMKETLLATTEKIEHIKELTDKIIERKD